MEVTIMQKENNTEQNETMTIVMERLPELDEGETSTA